MFHVLLSFHCSAFFDFILACPPYHQTSFREPSHPRAKSVPMTSHFGPFSHLVARVLPKIGSCVNKKNFSNDKFLFRYKSYPRLKRVAISFAQLCMCVTELRNTAKFQKRVRIPLGFGGLGELGCLGLITLPSLPAHRTIPRPGRNDEKT